MASRRLRTGRRRAFALFAGGLVLLALVALGIAVYGADPVRVVALLQHALRRDLGLVLGYEGTPRMAYWPRLGVALEGYRIDVAATAKPLAWGDALVVEVPWRALRSESLEIERVELDAPVFHAAGLEGWRLPGAGGAPRWPRIASGVVVRDAKWIGSGVPPRVVQGVSVELSPVARDVALSLSGTWKRAGEVPPLSFEIDATPRDLPDALGLEPLALVLREGDAPAARFEGSARYAATTRWSFGGRLETTRLPDAIAAYVAPAGAPQPATALDLALEASDAGWHVVADGTLAGAALDADLTLSALPDFSAPLPALLESLQRDVHGRARIARLVVGGMQFEGVELGDGAADATGDDDAARAQ